MSLVVVQPGPQTLVQDLGRPGWAYVGVSRSGAFDRSALRQANALLGNPARAAALEVLGGGLVLRVTEPLAIAVTGAIGPISIAGRSAPAGRAVALGPGDELHLGMLTHGLRAYVAVGGGITIPEVLGSRSRDTLGEIGPIALAPGDELPVGPAHPLPDLHDIPALLTDGDLTLAVMLGPRDDWFTPAATAQLLTSAWQVSADSSRVGIRLTGPALERARSGELESEPVLRGSIQVTSAGQPVVLGPDHPVTGGYPVIAVIADRDTDRLAQARPGQYLRFTR